MYLERLNQDSQLRISLCKNSEMHGLLKSDVMLRQAVLISLYQLITNEQQSLCNK